MAQQTTTTVRVHLRVAGWVPDDWSDRFEGISVRHTDAASTVLSGIVRDQSAFFGVLRTIEARGMRLLAAVVRSAALLALLFVPFAAPARAEALGFEEALQRALASNPSLVRARAETGVARAQRGIALSAVLPHVDAEAAGTRYDREASADIGGAHVTLQPRTDWAARLTLAQPLYLGGRATKAIAQADLALDAARAAEAAARERTLLETASDYLALVAADARIAVELQNVDLASSRRRNAASLLDAGEATRVDVLRAETALKAAERQLADARQERLEAESRLRLDVVTEGAIDAAAPAAPLPEVPSVEELTARALAAHPELRRSADGVRIAGLEVGRQRGARLPSVVLGAVLTRQESSFPSPNPAWVSLSVRLPLFDGGEAAARVAEAHRREEQAASADAEARNAVREEICRAAAGLTTARKTLELAKEQLAAAEAEHAQVAALYRAQEATSLEIDAAEASLAGARRAVVAQTLASQIAGLRVLYAAGSLHPTLLK